MDLFDAQRPRPPLAERLRPQRIEDYAGQGHLLAPGRPLRRALEEGVLHSMVLWGPPGTGKTTLAGLIARYWSAQFLSVSAVLSGVKDIRAAVEQARQHAAANAGAPTIVFVDEVHRFNKAQQDAFLPHIEDGSIHFIGATTENPSFELNNALLSRLRTYVLRSLGAEALQAVVARGIQVLAEERDLPGLSLDPEAEAQLLRAADGDARRALNMLEMAVDLVQADASSSPGITAEQMREIGTQSGARFDKGGEAFYDQISALHKSVRGSDPDAALYWCARMLEGGCDPVYLARRLVRIASEDVGNADPRALPLCVSAWDAYLRLGSPEGELALAHAVAYLAVAPKSNAVYTAFGEAWRDAREQGSLEVPLHLRNAPTELMRELGYGAEYRYDPDEPGGHAAGQTYLPEALRGRRYYRPRAAGLEIQIGQRLAALRAADEKK